jgi:hypothetical protein
MGMAGVQKVYPGFFLTGGAPRARMAMPGLCLEPVEGHDTNIATFDFTWVMGLLYNPAQRLVFCS